jgi:hypothetical protein
MEGGKKKKRMKIRKKRGIVEIKTDPKKERW